MNSRFYRTAAPLITRIQKLFSEDLAKENDFLSQESRILSSKLCKQVPLTGTDRRTSVRCGIPIRERLREVTSIVCPKTLLAWNRRMKRRKRAGTASFGFLNLLIPNPCWNANYRNNAANNGRIADFVGSIKTLN